MPSRFPRSRRRGNDRGATALEFAGILMPALLVIFIAFQAYVSSTSVERVQNAARTGAREASQRHNPALCRTYAERTLPDWLNEYWIEARSAQVGGDDAVACRVRAKLPLIFKGVPLDYTVDRTVTLPLG